MSVRLRIPQVGPIRLSIYVSVSPRTVSSIYHPFIHYPTIIFFDPLTYLILSIS